MKIKIVYKIILTVILTLAFIIGGYNLLFADYTILKRVILIATLLLIGLQTLINWSDIYKFYKK